MFKDHGQEFMGRMLNKLMLEVYNVVSETFIHMIASVSIYDC